LSGRRGCAQRAGAVRRARAGAAPGDAVRARARGSGGPSPDRARAGGPAHPDRRPGAPVDVSLGSAGVYPATRRLLRPVAAAIRHLPNKVSITGHTDSIAFRRNNGYDNWSLSLDRADATRRELVAAGLDPARLATVVGKADTDHLYPDDPRDPRNRRISITLLRDELAPNARMARADRD